MSQPTRDPLVTYSAAELARRISDRQISATDATRAYISSLQDLHARCNVLSCQRFDAALQEARAADEYQSKHESVGPWHGVPITVKDCFHVQGLTTQLGLVGRDAVATEDAAIVRRLRELGAILLGKTNVSQAMALAETVNPVVGRTVHPTHADRATGGSSGGEAAAVAGYGSAFGMATDMAGSIRVPAHFCGAAALKPTSGLLDLQGVSQVFPLALPIPTTAGPIARRVEDLRLAMRLLARTKSTDGNSRDVASQRRFAVWTEDDVFPTAPVVGQVVQRAADTLCALGYERVAWPRFELKRILELQLNIMFADGGQTIRDAVGTGERDPLLDATLRLAGLPGWLRPLLSWLANPLQRPFDRLLLRSLRRSSVAELWKLAGEAERMRESFQSQWRRHNIQVLLTPVFPLPALPHGYSERVGAAFSFPFLCNLMDLPAGVVPFGRIETDGDTAPAAAWHVPNWVHRVMSGASGLPVGVQVIGDRFQEAIVLNVMHDLEQARGW
jgi:fatty acid amide hydrolase